MCYNYSSYILFSATSSKVYSYFSCYLICSSCASIRWVSSLVFSIVFVWSYGSTNNTGFTLVLWCTSLDLVGPEIYVSTFLLNYLGLHTCLWFLLTIFSVADFFLINNCPMKGNVSDLPSCWINNSLTYFLLIPHARQFTFRCGGDKLIDIW